MVQKVITVQGTDNVLLEGCVFPLPPPYNECDLKDEMMPSVVADGVDQISGSGTTTGNWNNKADDLPFTTNAHIT